MDEQELKEKKKIEKREKTDIVLSYILIVILVICIAVVLYIKFGRNNDVKGEEHTVDVISLDYIADALNDSELVKGYSADGVTFSSSTSDNLLVISYIKDDTNISMNIPLNANELVVTLNEDNHLIGEDIYKEIATIVCTYYSKDESACYSKIVDLDIDRELSGIRFEKDGDDTNVYIDIIKGIDIKEPEKVTYDTVTKVELSDVNYILTFDNEEINNIKVVNTDKELTFTGTVTTKSKENQVLAVLVKLYDADAKVLEEKTYDFSEEAPLKESGEFTVSFNLDDNLKLENIKLYSIEITR